MRGNLTVTCMDSFFQTPFPSLPTSTTLSVMAQIPVLTDNAGSEPLWFRVIVTQNPLMHILCLFLNIVFPRKLQVNFRLQIFNSNKHHTVIFHR